MWRRRGAKGERRERGKNERMGKKGFLSMEGWKGETPPPPPPRVELIARGRKGGEERKEEGQKQTTVFAGIGSGHDLWYRDEGRKKTWGISAT